MTDWSITDRRRQAFAELSGDHNPLHTDPVAARRLHGGRMLVHGAHLLLAVLDQAIAQGHLTSPPATVDVRFRHGIVPGQELTTEFAVRDADRLTARVMAGTTTAVEIAIGPGPPPSAGKATATADDGSQGLQGPDPSAPPPESPERTRPDDVALTDLPGRSGEIRTGGAPDRRAELFPSAATVLGPTMVRELALISRVVGMHAPGLRSMSSRYRITIGDPGGVAGPARLRYSVRSVDQRIRKVDVDVTGTTLIAAIEAFSPAGPIDQLGQLDGAARPDPSEFSDQRALVVGGSRGLGAATVVLLAAGGADVWSTYRVGAADAHAIARATGAAFFPYDVEDGPPAIDRALDDGWRPTHLYWFATPPYRAGRPGASSSANARDELSRVQVNAFRRMVEHVAGTGLRVALWPSCDLVERDRSSPDELADVKRHGEIVADELAARHPDVQVVVPRWPTLLTDQTVALLPTDYADTAATLLATLREL